MGLKDAGATWFGHLKDGLLKHNFAQKQSGPRGLFHKKDLVSFVCMDNCMMMTSKPHLINEFIKDVKCECELEDEGNINACSGINITRPAPTMIKLNQPVLIQCIINSSKLSNNCQHDAPANQILHRDTNWTSIADLWLDSSTT